MSEDQYTEYCLWYLDNHIPSSIAARDNIAGILVEPGLAEGGNWIPSTRFLSGIRDICDKNDWLMISDEVLTGLGRTGRMWGIEHYDVVPDILVYGKNLSGGIAPLCGISARDDIMGDNKISNPARHLPECQQGVPRRSGHCKSSNGTISLRMRNGSVISQPESCANGKRTVLCGRRVATAYCSV